MSHIFHKNKWHHRQVMLNSFRTNGHTLEFYPYHRIKVKVSVWESGLRSFSENLSFLLGAVVESVSIRPLFITFRFVFALCPPFAQSKKAECNEAKKLHLLHMLNHFTAVCRVIWFVNSDLVKYLFDD